MKTANSRSRAAQFEINIATDVSVLGPSDLSPRRARRRDPVPAAVLVTIREATHMPSGLELRCERCPPGAATISRRC